MTVPETLPLGPAPDRADWATIGPSWPMHAASRFVDAGGLRFHVQIVGAPLGSAPHVLLIHGTGASTHSWAGLAPLLAPGRALIMVDIPGHGFTGTPPRDDGLTLPGMAKALGSLITELGARPTTVIGHSAGAAILARMCLDRLIAPDLLVSLNGAFRPYQGSASGIFSSIARLLFMNSLTPRVLAWRARDRALVERVIAGTGSKLSPGGLDRYHTLFQRPVHVAGALGMMAGWDLRPLERDLPRLPCRLLLVACGRDDAIPPDVAFRVRDIVGPDRARVEYIRDLGHLAHEEAPERVAAIIEAA